jgi:hypothetical protein
VNRKEEEQPASPVSSKIGEPYFSKFRRGSRSLWDILGAYARPVLYLYIRLKLHTSLRSMAQTKDLILASLSASVYR